jgi:hypothetical protein
MAFGAGRDDWGWSGFCFSSRSRLKQKPPTKPRCPAKNILFLSKQCNVDGVVSNVRVSADVIEKKI